MFTTQSSHIPMPLVPLFGHERLREQFAAAQARGALPASMLLHGPRGVGKQRLALWLGQALLCTGDSPRPCGKCAQCRYSFELRHPDLQWVFPRPRLKDSDPSLEDVRDDYADAISERLAHHGLYPPPSGSDGIYVAIIRAVVRAAALSPALAAHKVFIVGDAERMVSQEGSDQAANAFLKLLEEPPADTTLILTSSEPGALLPTVRSRVISIRVAPVTERDVRAFVGDPLVSAQLRADKLALAVDELVETAGGAPGRLLAASILREAAAQARRIFDAATSKDPSLSYRVAFTQRSSGARGSFSDSLNALEVLLHHRAREATRSGRTADAAGAAKALELVERAKEQATSNVNPQLLTAGLIRDMSALMK